MTESDNGPTAEDPQRARNIPAIVETQQDKAKSWFTLFVEHPVQAFLIALAAIAIPILWDVYRTTTEMQVRIIEAVQLVDEEVFHSGFAVTHRGESLASLARVSISVRNTGSKAIGPSQIVRQPTIEFPKSVSILAIRVNGDDKQKLDDDATYDGSKIEMPIELLNPGEEIRILVYAEARARDLLSPSADARIEYLDKFDVINLVEVVEAAGEQAAIAHSRSLGALFWLFCPVALLLIAFVVFIGNERAQQRRLQRRLDNDEKFLDGFATFAELRDFVNGEMPFPAEYEKEELVLSINAIEGDDTMETEAGLAAARHEIGTVIRDNTVARDVLGFAILLLVPLMSYLGYSLLRYFT